MSACLLSLSVMSLLLPVRPLSMPSHDDANIPSQTAFHASFSNLEVADEVVVKVSRGTSVVSKITVAAFSIPNTKDMLDSTPRIHSLSALPAEITRVYL